MQKIEKYKTQKLSKFNQLILLNDEGFIEDSCNSIFPTDYFKANPFTHYFPFLESVFPNLLELKVEGKELRFAKIESPLKELPGVYDFTFARVLLDEEESILWSIYDYTSLYEDFKQYQQKRNELEMHREMLEARNRKLHRQKDLLAQKNLALENWDQLRKDYYNKVRLALESPVNALDGLSFILANISGDQDQDYISALRASVKHLQDIISEFELITTIDGNKQISQIQVFDLRQVIAAVIKKLTPVFPDENDLISCSFLSEIPEKLLGNPLHLQQILHQLLLNAQKHHPPTHLALLIDGHNAEDDGQWLLQIKILESPVDDFAEADNGFLQKTNGDSTADLILRLSLVKKLIELEGGSIQVANRTHKTGFLLQCQLPYLLVE